MSCARPVIISNIRGLWSHLLKDGENCLMVPPGDKAALAAAINKVVSDPELASRLGSAARETAVAYFSLDALGQSTLALARQGLELRAERQPRRAQ
jgi:glycosyltransferase involved in cell wall biosynthesis